MTDSLCGGSNALQNFQKHTSVDRALQQDRILNRQSPSQGFRSQNPNVGALDAEFEAFEANHTTNLHSAFEQFTEFATPHRTRYSHFFPASAGDGWAADFQRLHVSDAPPTSTGSHVQPTPTPQQLTPRVWMSEFLQQPQQQSPYALGFQPSFATNPTFGGVMAQTFPAPQEQLPGQSQSQTEIFDESAFDAAFGELSAQNDLQQSETTPHEESATGNDNVKSDMQATFQQLEQIRIGSDTIPPSYEVDDQQRRDDSDELARTAGQLVERLDHESNQKFKDSAFLALMRRIRDHEVQVEGDEFREITQPLHPGGQRYPEGWTSTENKKWQMPGARISPPDLDKFDDVEESVMLHLKFSS